MTFKLWIHTQDDNPPPNAEWRWGKDNLLARKFINLYLNERVSDNYILVTTTNDIHKTSRINFKRILLDLGEGTLSILEQIGRTVDDTFFFKISSTIEDEVNRMKEYIISHNWNLVEEE